MRVRSIDAFRGISIVLMVFFTLINRLAVLPDILRHNVPDALHFGDFVLPFFLFASGMSLFFFAKKRETGKKSEYALDIIERFGKLVLISFFLSPFTAGLFGMDEVMLNALLFIPSVILLALPELVLIFVALAIFALYFIISSLSLLSIHPSAYYLGGYAAAPFYLPVMLFGVVAGRRIAEGEKLAPLLAVSVVLSAILLFLVPPQKMFVTPSFMGLSITLSLVFFMLVDFFENNKKSGSGVAKRIEILFLGFFGYLGVKPIRYWGLMFVLFIIPASFYALAAGLDFPFGLNWMEAVAISVFYVFFLYAISRGMDEIAEKLKAVKR